MGKPRGSSPQTKINVTSKSPVGDISVVTLIRTDTTLDHSQKAEKVCSTYARRTHPSSIVQSTWFSRRGTQRQQRRTHTHTHTHAITQCAPIGPRTQPNPGTGVGTATADPAQIHATKYAKGKRRLELRCLSATEVTASCSGLLSHHCRWCSVLPALLPAWAGSRVTTCQAAHAYAGASLQTTCLVGASHPHGKQDM